MLANFIYSIKSNSAQVLNRKNINYKTRRTRHIKTQKDTDKTKEMRKKKAKSRDMDQNIFDTCRKDGLGKEEHRCTICEF